MAEHSDDCGKGLGGPCTCGAEDESWKEHVCFQSDVELINASWSLDSGRMVEFRIAGDAYGRLHPFKRYQQRRGGRMGTRFMASIADHSTQQLRYHGELMLAAWGDNSQHGQTIKFWLDDEADRHPFAGFNRRRTGSPGDMFYIALAEINDDNSVIDQQARERADPAQPPGAAMGPGSKHPRGKKPAKFSSSAHLMVTGAMFVQYLTETHPNGTRWTPERARIWAKQTAQLESLSDLDRDPHALRRFRDRVQRPFARWNGQEP